MQMAVNSDVVAPIVEVVNTIEEEAKVIEYMPINKPSDRFDIDDYIAYQEYMIKHGGVPSIEDYFKAIEYYKNRA
jgi:molybdenum cofactor biosynthesis enzyme MoaA